MVLRICSLRELSHKRVQQKSELILLIIVFDWNFTQNDYHFHLEYREVQGIPNFKLYFSEKPDDCWDWQEIKDCLIWIRAK